jgi:hypothetical protein
MRTELDLPDLYQMVREGTWTYDKMAEMAQVAQSDLNGDGRINEADRVGIANNATTIYEALLTGCDAELVKQGDDGVPYFFCLDNQEEFVNVYQSLLSTYTANDRLLITSDAEKMFTDEKVLFYVGTLSAAVRMRQFEMDLGILPVPKWDEKQENYHTLASTQMLLLPADMSDPEFVGVVLEALSAESYREVTPLLYDVVYTNKYLRDDYSKEMFGMFRGNRTTVKMRFENSLAGVVVDRFGKDILMTPHDPDHFTLQTNIILSPNFFAWLCRFAGRATIVYPQSAVESFRSYCRNILSSIPE